MNLIDVVMASLVLMVGASAAAQLWSQALRSTWDQALREERLQALDALLLASEGQARELVASKGTREDCALAKAELATLLRTLPTDPGTALILPASPPGMVYLRWENGPLRRERLLSATALGLCREVDHGT